MSEAEEIIVSTKARAGPFDALVTAKPGEPIFVVQGGDPFGPPTVLHWARLAREAGLAETNRKRAKRLLRKATNAEEVAWAMQAYQRGETVAPAEEAPTYYSGNTATADAEAARERHAMLVKGCDKLHNSVAESNDFAEALAGIDMHPEAVTKIKAAVALLKEAAAEIEPRHQLRRKEA